MQSTQRSYVLQGAEIVEEQDYVILTIIGTLAVPLSHHQRDPQAAANHLAAELRNTCYDVATLNGRIDLPVGSIRLAVKVSQ